jgi:septum formation protein
MSASLAVRFRKLLSSQPASRIILGTASSSRRQIMDGLATDFNFSYEVVKADIDEKAIRHTQPRQLVTALAHAKADAIVAKLHQQQLSAPQDQQQQPSSAGAVSAGDPTTSSSSAGVNTTSSSSSYLITCDQVVVHEGVIREKPEDVAEAHRCGGWRGSSAVGCGASPMGWSAASSQGKGWQRV